jgi:outer membrane protein assembly factor BamB
VIKPLTIVFSILCGATCLCEAQEWTRFRGPNGTGVSDAKTIPTKWTDADFNWKLKLDGTGHSSPVCWGDKVFVTSCDERSGKFFIHCVSATDGKMQWQKEFPIAPHEKHALNSLATSTPTVDADHIYVCRTDPTSVKIIALNHRGEKVWERDLGTFEGNHGSGTSPIVYEGMVILSNDQDRESSLIAMDAKTGRTRWQTPRKSRASNYSTPCIYKSFDGKPVLIFNSEPHGISAIAPDTGKPVWEFTQAFDKRSVSSPVIAAGLLLGSCGSGGGGNYLVAVRPPTGEGKSPERAYEVRRSAPYVPTSVCVGNKLFLWSDAGIVSLVDAPTGEVKWQERAGGTYYSSPVCVDGRLFCPTTTGEMVVVSASDKFEVLARNPLGEQTHSTPAVSGGRMFIHTAGHLLSIGGKVQP